LTDFCSENKFNLIFYSSDELNGAEKVFKSSEFVMSITGTDNVCERSSYLSSDKGKCIAEKTIIDSVTFSAYISKWGVCFG